MAVTFSQFTGLNISSTGARTITKTLTANSAVSLAIFSSTPARTWTVSDGVNSYSVTATSPTTGTGQKLIVYTATAVAGGSTTITITPDIAHNWGCEAFEVLDVATTSVVDVSAVNTDDSTTVANGTPSPGIAISAGSGVVSFWLCDRTPNATGPTGWTAGTATINGYPIWSYVATKIFSGSASGERAVLASHDPMHYESVVVAYKAASGGSSVIPVISRSYRQRRI